MRIERLFAGPIITPGMDESMGTNVQGPSLIRVPDWVEDPLGRYYLYFADHKGSYIRLAFADDLEGPWKTHPPGSLQLPESHFLTEEPEVPEQSSPDDLAPAMVDAGTPHIASPDVHVFEDRREIILYFHGLAGFAIQVTRVATSTDGIRFRARPEVLGLPYFRMFRHGGFFYALAMPGLVYRSRDPLSGFERGPRLFCDDMRHSALLLRGERLHVFWTRVGDTPERILRSEIDVSGDWMEWTETEPVEVLRPQAEREGAGRPLVPSVRGAIQVPANQLRDPAIYEENGRVYLLYSVCGEGGIAVAEVFV